MTKYLVFEYDNYYPGGGMNDCELVTDDIIKVKEHVRNWADQKETSPADFLNVYDVEEGQHIFKASFDVDYEDIGDVKRTLKTKVDEMGFLRG